ARPAYERLDAREQLLAAERLRHVVVRAALETPNLLELPSARRQHHHRHLAEVADPLEGLPAVELGHRDVKQDEVRRRGVELTQAGLPALGLRDVVPSPHEQLARAG